MKKIKFYIINILLVTAAVLFTGTAAIPLHAADIPDDSSLPVVYIESGALRESDRDNKCEKVAQALKSDYSWVTDPHHSVTFEYLGADIDSKIKFGPPWDFDWAFGNSMYGIDTAGGICDTQEKARCDTMS